MAIIPNRQAARAVSVPRSARSVSMASNAAPVAPTRPKTAVANNGLGNRQQHKQRVLVVDDEKNIRMTIQHSLLAADYEVETASDGAEGLDKFRNSTYDLVLMDLRMPQMNGIEMLREIREHDKHTAAIVITAYLTIDTLIEAFSLG
ncbi:MAG TPA: response regulator, partial [Candidatus Kapabacteria bacterium]